MRHVRILIFFFLYSIVCSALGMFVMRIFHIENRAFGKQNMSPIQHVNSQTHGNEYMINLWISWTEQGKKRIKKKSGYYMFYVNDTKQGIIAYAHANVILVTSSTKIMRQLPQLFCWMQKYINVIRYGLINFSNWLQDNDSDYLLPNYEWYAM